MSKNRRLAIIYIIPFFLLTVCVSTPPAEEAASLSLTENKEQEVKAEQELKEEQVFQQAVADDPYDAETYHNMGYYYYTRERYISAAGSWEKALELEPDFRIETTLGFHWTPNTASKQGVRITRNLNFNDFSLYLFLATAYYDAVLKPVASPDNPVSEQEKQSLLEKAFTAYSQGYNIDIITGKNDDRNLKTIYLGFIGTTLDLLGRNDLADSIFIELAKIADVDDAIAKRIDDAIAGSD
ncbi:MAG: hypothetical protein FWG99_10085 [Treponema sp.]|nr:hypothetical protein [Treponema sp.]